jgi:hypothetical protein
MIVVCVPFRRVRRMNSRRARDIPECGEVL